MIVGVTSADDPTPEHYVAAVERCGGRVRVLLSDHATLPGALDGLDALLVTGGSDIEPARYGATPHPANDAPDPRRDAFELAAVRRATELGLPLLMICRGMQIANVAYGGTLHQHLPDLVDGSVEHRDLERKFETLPDHAVTIEPDALLARLTGATRCATNASHHQAVDVVGAGLRVVARTDDGVVEALERPDAPGFWLATQWHPERLLDVDDGRSRRIFDAFLAAADRYGAPTATNA